MENGKRRLTAGHGRPGAAKVSRRKGKKGTKHRRLSRSFATLEEAKRFAEGKQNTDIYRSKGLYKVEWEKVTQI